jgi:hypothetical protein
MITLSVAPTQSTCHPASTTPEEALAVFHTTGIQAEVLPPLSLLHTKRLK